MKRVLVCPTAFKGTLSAGAVAAAIAAGVRAAEPGVEVEQLPLSDGGNGLLDALEAAEGGDRRLVTVAGPVGEPVSSQLLVQAGRVVVETAEACGLHLVRPERRDPWTTTTRGVGELLRAARAAAGRDHPLVVGLGGSATVDAGAGMAQALGWRLLDGRGRPIGPGGGALTGLAAIEPPDVVPGIGPLLVLADVTNPLLGPGGAARVFGPQKGATPEQVEELERGLTRWSDVVRRDLGVDVRELIAAGAAGGLGAAFAALLDARPVAGSEWVLDAVGFERALRGASLVVTGEGAWDAQSSMGKATGEVVERAVAAGVPMLLVAGSIDAPVPAGVTVAAGAGGTPGSGGRQRSTRPLDEGEIARRVENAVRGLLAPRRRP